MILSSRFVRSVYVISKPGTDLSKSVADMTIEEAFQAYRVALDVLWMPTNISLLVMVVGFPIMGFGLVDQAWTVVSAGIACIAYGAYFQVVVVPAARRLQRSCLSKLETGE